MFLSLPTLEAVVAGGGGAVLDRRRGIEATGEPTRTRTNRISGPTDLPIAITDRAAAVV